MTPDDIVPAIDVIVPEESHGRGWGNGTPDDTGYLYTLDLDNVLENEPVSTSP